MTKEQLIQQIKGAIKTNGAQEITAALLQGALTSMIDVIYDEIGSVAPTENPEASSFIVQTLGQRTDVAVSQKITTDIVEVINTRLNALAGLVTRPAESYVLEIEGILDEVSHVQYSTSLTSGDVYFVNKAILNNGTVFTDCFVLRNNNGYFTDWSASDTDNSSIYGTSIGGKVTPRLDKVFKDVTTGKLYVFAPGVSTGTGSFRALNDAVKSITHIELLKLIDTKGLVPGMQYRITDFVTTCAASETTSSAGHAFDIIVTADTDSTLNANARACLHEGNDYFAESRLSEWEIKYDVNNDTSKYGWADPRGKGVIYHMKDEFGNEAPYDFKNIMFNSIYTFGGTTDASLSSARGNKIGEYWAAGKRELNGIVLISTALVNNVFSDNCADISLMGACLGNSFQRECRNMVVRSADFTSNDFGRGCANINVIGSLRQCKFGDGCGGIVISGDLSREATWHNLDVKPGVVADTANPIDLSGVATRAFHVTTVAKNSAGTIKIYNEADLVQ